MTKLEKKKVVALFEAEWEVDEDYTYFKVIEEGEWINEGAYQYNTTIVKFMNKHYQITQYRSGSYYGNYEYYDTEIFEVIPREDIGKTVIWEKV